MFAALCCLSCQPAARNRRPHVVLISIDTLRPDHLGCYGYERQTSPNIDRLAREGTRYTRAYSPTSWTLPAHMSMFTSQTPSHHGIVEDRYALGQDATTLAEVIQAGGYDTAAITSWIYVGRKFGFDQGFAHFEELAQPQRRAAASGTGASPARTTTDAAIRWLQRPRENPAFLFVHYFDPHMNYEPPPPYDIMFDADYRGDADGSYTWAKPFIAAFQSEPRAIDARDREHMLALYDGEIAYTDAHVGRLLDAVDRELGLDNCIVVLTSDHGEEFGEHGSLEGHGWTLYDEVLNVPLIVRWPGHVAAGRAVDDPVTLVDLGPTVLDLLKLTRPASFAGRSVLESAPGQPRWLFAESDRFGVRKRSLRGPRYKIISTEDTGGSAKGLPIREGLEVFDLIEDPGETNDLSTRDSTRTSDLAKLLAEATARASSGSMTASARDEELSAEEEERLRSLGYIR